MDVATLRMPTLIGRLIESFHREEHDPPKNPRVEYDTRMGASDHNLGSRRLTVWADLLGLRPVDGHLGEAL